MKAEEGKEFSDGESEEVNVEEGVEEQKKEEEDHSTTTVTDNGPRPPTGNIELFTTLVLYNINMNLSQEFFLWSH